MLYNRVNVKCQLFIVLLLLVGSANAVYSATLNYTTRKNTMEWFEGARFGIFIHWDARSNWEPGAANVDIRPQLKNAQEAAIWDDLPDHNPGSMRAKRWQSWNPDKFDAQEWVQLILDSRAKYFTFTTMHAFGLANFDHPVSTWDIMSTPYAKDIVAQLAAAAKGRIPVMWYYNMDAVRHLQGQRWDQFSSHLTKGVTTFDQFRKAGIHELVCNTEKFGKVAGIWCDGGGKFEKKPRDDFYKKMKQAQPWLIFSPRCGHPDVPKDFRVPEQKLPRLNWETHQEMTMPIESTLWFWSQGKAANTKDVQYCIETLIDTATRDANLLLNISPKGNGEIDGYQAEILRGIGDWLRLYGDTIFETRAGPYEAGLWGGSTRKGNKVYLHLTQKMQDGRYRLPALPSKVVSFKLLTGGSVNVRQSEEFLSIQLDREAVQDKNTVDYIVELTIAGNAWSILPNQVIPVESAKAISARATASSENTYKRPSGKGVTNAASNVLEGRPGYWSASEPWSQGAGDPAPWLKMDLDDVRPFQAVRLVENHSRIRRFILEYQDAGTGKWSQFYSGQRLNHLSYRMTKLVSARYIRIGILETKGGAAQVSQFEIY